MYHILFRFLSEASGTRKLGRYGFPENDKLGIHLLKLRVETLDRIGKKRTSETT